MLMGHLFEKSLFSLRKTLKEEVGLKVSRILSRLFQIFAMLYLS